MDLYSIHTSGGRMKEFRTVDAASRLKCVLMDGECRVERLFNNIFICTSGLEEVRHSDVSQFYFFLRTEIESEKLSESENGASQQCVTISDG